MEATRSGCSLARSRKAIDMFLEDGETLSSRMLPRRIDGLIFGDENTSLGENYEEQQLQTNPTMSI